MKFLDLLLGLEVYREVRRVTHFLVAAKSLNRGAIGFFGRLMSSSESVTLYADHEVLISTVPVVRAADEAKPGTGRIDLSAEDPCLVIGHGTRFLSDFKPKMQIMLLKSLNSAVAEVVEVLSDTELRIKKEFGGESGKGTVRIRAAVQEAAENDEKGIPYKKLPYIDQQDMYRHVYQTLTDGGCIGIFPEGEQCSS